MIKNTLSKISFIFGLLFLLLTTQSCESSKGDTSIVLASINDFTVTTSHFENAFKEYYFRTGQVLTPDIETKKAILNSEFNTYVMAVFAKDLKLDKSEFAIQQEKAIKRRVVNEEYLNQIILGNIEVTEAELEEYFIRFNSQLRASHLYSKTEEGINALYNRLQNGESFEELAKEVFTNSYLAENGGDIGRFTTDDLDIAFENAAFSLRKGEISTPIQTAQGFSIVKLTEKITKPIITENEFLNKKDQLFSYVLKKKKELKTREHLNQFTENSSLNEQLIDQIWVSVENNPEGFFSKDFEFISGFSNYKGEITSYKTESLTIQNFIEEYQISSALMLNTINDKSSFIDFIKGISYRTYLFNEAKKIEIDKNELVIDSINETYYHFLASESDRYLRNSIKNTPAELYEEFSKNDEVFEKPLEVNFSRIVLSTKEDAESILERIGNGESFEKLVNQYTINNEDKFTSGEQGFKSIKDYGFNGMNLSKLRVNEVSEIIQYQENEYHIYKCLGRTEPRMPIFAEVQDLVNDYVTRNKLQVLRAETIQKVKQKHNAVIDLEKLQELTIQI